MMKNRGILFERLVWYVPLVYGRILVRYAVSVVVLGRVVLGVVSNYDEPLTICGRLYRLSGTSSFVDSGRRVVLCCVALRFVHVLH